MSVGRRRAVTHRRERVAVVNGPTRAQRQETAVGSNGGARSGPDSTRAQGARHGPKQRPTLGPHWAHMGPQSAPFDSAFFKEMGPHGPTLGQVWAQCTPTWAQRSNTSYAYVIPTHFKNQLQQPSKSVPSKKN
jgi:hypothetical protein